jgi:uncharacterized protein YprB with RNaseH-like and TPR domain
MAQAPVHKMKKDEILKLAAKHCKAHGHTYLEHYSCYLKEVPEAEERIGFLDIEASNLDADFGIILSWCIKDSLSNKIYSDVLTPTDVKKGYEDKRIVQSLVDTMRLFDRVVGFYSTNFDIPFIRARASIVGVEFLKYGELKHKDIYYLMKSKYKISSRRLENCCRVVLGHTEKTRIDAKFWRNGVRGDKKALKYILDHNEKDVLDLEKLYWKVIDYQKADSRSI